MYYINFNKLDENMQKEIIKFFKKYYSGAVYDDRSLRKHINDKDNVKISLTIKNK